MVIGVTVESWGYRGRIKEEKLQIKTGRAAKVEFCKTAQISLLYCETQNYERGIFFFSLLPGIWCGSDILMHNCHLKNPICQQQSAKEVEPLERSVTGPRGSEMLRTEGLSRRKSGQQGKKKKMGPCVVPIRNHVGFSAITAGPFSRSRSPAITDEKRVREICYYLCHPISTRIYVSWGSM